MFLNCDLGESQIGWTSGKDKELLSLMDMVNISCGAHAGDPRLIEETIALAKELNKQIGAHPSYADRENFGRKSLKVSLNVLESQLIEQLQTFKIAVEKHKGSVSYIKPHGALYHDCLRVPAIFTVLLKSCNAVFGSLPMMLMNTPKTGEFIIKEAFVDRKYENQHTLVARSIVGSLISNTDEALEQYISIAKFKNVKCMDGSLAAIHAESICIHSDTENALEIAQKIIKYRKDKAD